MTRLYSYQIYIMIFMLPAFYVFAGFIAFAGGSFNAIFLFFLLPLPYWIYVICYSRKVYYKDAELYVSGLFSNKFTIIKKDKVDRIDQSSSRRNIYSYKITYYDENDNVKHFYFGLNSFVNNGEKIVSGLEETT